MVIYRLHRSARAAEDYTGAFLVGGRWNPPGTNMLYASSRLSLACLETLVHLDKGELPAEYVWSSARLTHEPNVLAVESLTDIEACRVVGNRWAQAAKELAVLVYSVVIPQEFNVLLNPTHPLYAELAWSKPETFQFDSRLFAFQSEPP